MRIAALLAPGALSALDKPLHRQLDRLDDATRKREISKAMSYIRYRKLITEDYQHGIILTDKAKYRLARNEINSLEIPRCDAWDNLWRIVFFDIPEKQKTKRDAFAAPCAGWDLLYYNAASSSHLFPVATKLLYSALIMK